MQLGGKVIIKVRAPASHDHLGSFLPANGGPEGRDGGAASVHDFGEEMATFFGRGLGTRREGARCTSVPGEDDAAGISDDELQPWKVDAAAAGDSSDVGADDQGPELDSEESMRSILLLFAKLNPAVGYVQGMNEVLAPLFYVFSSDPDAQQASDAEADSFFCFVSLLSNSVDHFCPQLDNSPKGILSTLADLSQLLKANDEELWRHLELANKVRPQFYAFRWITLLLTQEFSLPAVIRIWDALLGNPSGVQEMLLRVCCAMMLCVRRELLEGDFMANVKLLQSYPRVDLERLLNVAGQVATPESPRPT